MEYDLLIRQYDYYCDLFIEGKIPYKLLLEIEAEYIKRKYLFTINLN